MATHQGDPACRPYRGYRAGRPYRGYRVGRQNETIGEAGRPYQTNKDYA
jgi:hypothetical protein